MKLFYDFLNLLLSDGYNSFEDKKTFKIEFNFENYILDFTNYVSFLEIENYYKNCISLYFRKSITDEQNLFEYLVDEEEFHEEVEKFNVNTKFTLIIDKASFIEKKIGIDSNILFFVENSKFIELINKDISSLEAEVFNKDKKNIFIMGDVDQYFYNKFYMVTYINRTKLSIEISEFIHNSKDALLINKIDVRNRLCNWIDGSHFLQPEILHCDFNNSKFTYNNSFNNIIWKRTIDLIIPFISNFTGIIDNKYMSLINGNKTIKIYYDLKLEVYDMVACEHLYELYKWIYEQEQATFDKINICRNVISVLVTAKCQGSEYKTIIQNSDWLAKSVEDNFVKFLQENINSFFNEQNTVIKKLSDNLTGINNQVSELTKLTTTNITSLLGTAVAATIGYIAKGNILYIKILFFLYLCFLIINSFFNLPISIIRAVQYKNDFKLNKEMYLKYYPDDSNIKGMEKRNDFNLVVFWLYTFFTVALIVVIIIIIINTDINILIENFNNK